MIWVSNAYPHGACRIDLQLSQDIPSLVPGNALCTANKTQNSPNPRTRHTKFRERKRHKHLTEIWVVQVVCCCRWDDQELQSATLVLLHQLPLELLHLLHLSHNMSCYTILFHLFPLAPDQQDCVYLTAMAAVECGGFMWGTLVYLPRSSWV